MIEISSIVSHLSGKKVTHPRGNPTQQRGIMHSEFLMSTLFHKISSIKIMIISKLLLRIRIEISHVTKQCQFIIIILKCIYTKGTNN